MMKRRLFSLALACMLAICPFALAVPYQTLSELDGKPLGVKVGSIFDGISQVRFPDSPLLYFNSYTDMAQALLSRKIDSYMCDQPAAEVLCAGDDRFMILTERVQPDNYAMGIAKSERGAAIRNQLNAYLAGLRADGTLQAMQDKWLGSDDASR